MRVPKSLKSRIKQIAAYWTAKDVAKAREAGDEAADVREWSEGDVVVRLMTNGIEGAWKDAGLPAKPTQDQVDEKIEQLKSSN